jgi:hypothetical protein
MRDSPLFDGRLGRHPIPPGAAVNKKAEWSIHILQIHYLKARLAVCEHVCTSLAHEFDREGLTVDEKTAIAARWSAVMKDGYVLQLMMDLLNRLDRESRGEPSFEPGSH